MDYKSDVMEHKTRVSIMMSKISRDLVRRGNLHDNSKLKSPEMEIYEAHIDELSNAKFGTDEYTRAMDNIRPALNHHYENNDHHPEHFKDGIFDMNLIQIIEALCDIKAVQDKKGGNIIDTLPTWMEQKNIPENYYMVLKNTLEYMGEL